MAPFISLTVFCACCWTLLDFQRKLLAGHVNAIALSAALALTLSPFYLVWWLFDLSTPGHGYWLYGITVAALGMFANVLFIRSVAISELSAVIPILCVTPMISATLAYAFLGERLSRTELAGIALVTAGIALILWQPARSSNFKGALFMLLTAFCWSLTLILDKQALRFASLPFHGFFQMVLGALLAALWAAAAGISLGIVRTHRRRLALASLALGLAVASQYAAVREIDAGVLESIKRGVGVVGTLCLGAYYLAERITFRKLGGCALVIAATLLFYID